MAPEILPQSKQRHVSLKCDVYSFGVLLIELVKESQFTLDKLKIRKFIQRAQKIHAQARLQIVTMPSWMPVSDVSYTYIKVQVSIIDLMLPKKSSQ
jgi:serine/threonine protein kinase